MESMLRRAALRGWTVAWSLLFAIALAASPPKPISVPPSQYWDGIDGKWSTFGLQIGTPSQQIRTLPMTQEGSIWAVVAEGCTADDGSGCANSRGLIFDRNRSSSWDQTGLYGLNLIHEQTLGYSGNGVYGHDTATLGWPGDGLPSVDRAIVAGIATKDFYLGGLPLNPWPVNFTSLTTSTPSLMTVLKNQSKISSLTYGYTAGYFNNDPPIFGSLTLGGYDGNRRVSNDIIFPMGADISRDLYVAVQSIETGTTKLLPNPIYAFIDSAVPAIWLPSEACRVFERTFGLIWNDEDAVYLVSDALHTTLLRDSPTVRFTIGPQTTGQSLTVEMPYGAFDLNSSSPFSSNGGRYFPLKRADNSSQYTLGRAFLQNAYIVANYENYTFSVYQAAYPDTGVGQDLIRIPAMSEGKSSGLSTGAIVGIAVGAAVIGLAATALIFYFCCWKKRKDRPKEEQTLEEKRLDHEPLETWSCNELDATATPIHETDGTQLRHEMGTGYKTENKYMKPVELPSNEIAASEAHSESTTPYATPKSTPCLLGAVPRQRG